MITLLWVVQIPLHHSDSQAMQVVMQAVHHTPEHQLAEPPNGSLVHAQLSVVQFLFHLVPRGSRAAEIASTRQSGLEAAVDTVSNSLEASIETMATRLEASTEPWAVAAFYELR